MARLVETNMLRAERNSQMQMFSLHAAKVQLEDKVMFFEKNVEAMQEWGHQEAQEYRALAQAVSQSTHEQPRTEHDMGKGLGSSSFGFRASDPSQFNFSAPGERFCNESRIPGRQFVRSERT